MNIKEIEQKSRDEALKILISENKNRFGEIYGFRLYINMMPLTKKKKQLTPPQIRKHKHPSTHSLFA